MGFDIVKRIPFFLLLPLAVTQALAGNILAIRDTTVQINQRFPLTLELTNSDSIIAFQCDLELPPALTYQDSFIVSNRLQNHAVQIGRIEPNGLRILCYSTNNSSILGNSGPLLWLFCRSANGTGPALVQLKNGILANIRSQNVLDSLSDGLIQVLDPTEVKAPEPNQKDHTIGLYPNPVRDRLHIRLNSPLAEAVQISFFNIPGQQINKTLVFPSKNRLTEEILSINNLPAGRYIVTVRAQNNVIRQLFSVTK